MGVLRIVVIGKLTGNIDAHCTLEAMQHLRSCCLL